MTGRGTDRVLGFGYAILLAASLVVSLGWLAIGAVVAVATYSTSVAARSPRARRRQRLGEACWRPRRAASH